MSKIVSSVSLVLVFWKDFLKKINNLVKLVYYSIARKVLQTQQYPFNRKWAKEKVNLQKKNYKITR